MGSRKDTRKTWMISLTSLFLSITMFVGSTFAWFTGSASTGVNQIIAGNLDIELQYVKEFHEDGSVKTWETVNEETILFNDVETNLKTPNRWEPGSTEVVYLKVSNVGSLALQYQLAVDVPYEKKGTRVENGVEKYFLLSNYLLYGMAESDVEIEKYTSREEAQSAVSENAKKFSNSMYEGSLLAGESKYMALVVYMPTTVGNEANHKSGNEFLYMPVIEFGINLRAAQFPSESDSYDNQYDEGATYVEQEGQELPLYFTITSEGGTFTKGNYGIEIPTGAVSSSVNAVFSVEMKEASVDTKLFDISLVDQVSKLPIPLQQNVKVTLEIGKNIEVISVNHDGSQMEKDSYAYDSQTGRLTLLGKIFGKFEIKTK